MDFKFFKSLFGKGGVLRLAPLALAMAAAVSLSGARIAAAQEAKAASGAPYRIGVFLENYQDRCFSIGFGDAVRRFVEIEVGRLNRADGVSGRPIEPVYIEERDLSTVRGLSAEENEKRLESLGAKLYEEVIAAQNSGDFLGFVGPSLSGVSRHLFGKHGEELATFGAPFIARTSTPGELAAHDYVYIARPDDLERAAPIAEFFTAMGSQRVFFAVRSSESGRPGRSERLLEKIRDLIGPERTAGYHEIRAVKSDDWEKRDLIEESVDELVAKIKAAAPDMIYLAVSYAGRAAGLIARLRDEGVTAPLFFDSRLAAVADRLEGGYPAPIYSATRSGESLPGIANSALDAVTSQGKPEDWIFSGRLNEAYAERTEDGCEAAAASRALDFTSVDAPRNETRIGAGTAAADMVRLITRAAASAGADAEIEERRAAVTHALRSRYLVGRGLFEGSYDQWSFYSNRIAADRPPYFLKLLANTSHVIMAPRQYLRERPEPGRSDGLGSLRPIPTLYVDVDLIRAYNVDENTRTFFADFYLTIQPPEGDGPVEGVGAAVADIANIEFSNAYLDVKGSKGRQIAAQTISEGESGDVAFPPGIKVYKVSGRFFFTPSLRRYPFDKQLFTIDIQPRKIAQPFLIQPPLPELRNGDVDSDNWNLRDSRVTIESAVVPIVDTLRSEPTIAPFYRASYGWLMERETKDYYLRVLVPLCFILIVGYLSIFISREHFEAIITIQVTALLSSVALYLAVPQVEADSTTVSDWIFLFSYLTISLMIAISICRINKVIARRLWLTELLRAVHIALIIPVVLAFTIYSIADVTDLVEWIGLVEASSDVLTPGG